MFFKLLTFYIKQLLKSRVYIGTHLFVILMLIINMILNEKESHYNNFGNFVGDMAVIIHAAFLIFIVCFYIFLSNEYRYGSEQFFAGSVKISVLKLIALFVNHFIILTIFTALQIIIVLTYFYFKDIKFSGFYLETAVYIFYYWFAPSILAFFIGILLALYFGRKHITYAIIIGIWLIIGPMNTEFFYNFFVSLHAGDIGQLLYLYPLNNSDVYRDIIGYNINFSSFLAFLIWILFICSLITAILIKGSHNKKVKLASLFISLSFIIVALSILPYAIKEKIPAFNYNKILEEAKYSQNRTPDIQDELLSYDIRNYKISIHRKDKVKATVEVDLDLWEEDPEQIAFSLYHSMKVNNVKNKKGDRIKFSQQGDFVFIHEPTDPMIFEYTMEDSALLPASKKYLFLPSYINWVPKKSNSPQLILDQPIEEDRIIVSGQEPADYELEITGIDNYYTNLPKKGKNTYSGEQVNGVTLIAGAIQKERLEDILLIYPQSWPDVKEGWNHYYAALKETHNYLNNMFNLGKDRIPDEIVFLTPYLKYSSFLTSDHLFIHHNTLYELGAAVHEIPEMYIPGILWSDVQTGNMDPGLIEAFNELLNDFLYEEIEYDTDIYYRSMIGLQPLDATIRYEDIHALGIDAFYENYSNMSKQEKKNFLISWYENFTSIEDWDEATSFMERFLKENR